MSIVFDHVKYAACGRCERGLVCPDQSKINLHPTITRHGLQTWPRNIKTEGIVNDEQRSGNEPNPLHFSIDQHHANMNRVLQLLM